MSKSDSTTNPGIVEFFTLAGATLFASLLAEQFDLWSQSFYLSLDSLTFWPRLICAALILLPVGGAFWVLNYLLNWHPERKISGRAGKWLWRGLTWLALGAAILLIGWLTGVFASLSLPLKPDQFPLIGWLVISFIGLTIIGFVAAQVPAYLGRRTFGSETIIGFEHNVSPPDTLILTMSPAEANSWDSLFACLTEVEKEPTDDPLMALIKNAQTCRDSGEACNHPWLQTVRVLRLNCGKPATDKKLPNLLLLLSHTYGDGKERGPIPNYTNFENCKKCFSDDEQAFCEFMNRLMKIHAEAVNMKKDASVEVFDAGGVYLPRFDTDDYDQMHGAISRAIRKALGKIPGKRVIVDITGGKASFSAAAMVACLNGRALVSYIHTIGTQDRSNLDHVPCATLCDPIVEIISKPGV